MAEGVVFPAPPLGGLSSTRTLGGTDREGIERSVNLLSKDVRQSSEFSSSESLTIEGGLPTGHWKSHQRQHDFDISPRFFSAAMARRIGADFDADFRSPTTPRNARLMLMFR